MTNASIAANTPTSEAFTANIAHLLKAQQLAVTARLSHHFSMENSVEVVITPSDVWSFTVACQMRNSDIGIHDDPDGLVVDLLMTQVPVERLVRAVEAEIAWARAMIETAIV